MENVQDPIRVNAEGIIDPYREMYYRFHQSIDSSQFPQVHDFYELTLVTSGAMELEVNGTIHELNAGTTVLLRPGDVHSRREKGGCSYINLAFSRRIMVELFHYLDDPVTCNGITEMEQPGVVELSDSETSGLQDRIEKLNLLPIDHPQTVCSQIKWLVLDIVMQYIAPTAAPGRAGRYPAWLRKTIHYLDDPDHFADTLQDLSDMTGMSREHICREFKRHLGLTPTQYLNQKRLNYAANLLLFSDRQVIDIAYAAGFQSLSRFYHAFRQQFGMAPIQYRKGIGR